MDLVLIIHLARFILAGKRTQKRLPRENNISMGLKEIWYEGVDWVHVAEERVQ
jgi:hypothetical protein